MSLWAWLCTKHMGVFCVFMWWDSLKDTSSFFFVRTHFGWRWMAAEDSKENIFKAFKIVAQDRFFWMRELESWGRRKCFPLLVFQFNRFVTDSMRTDSDRRKKWFNLNLLSGIWALGRVSSSASRHHQNWINVESLPFTSNTPVTWDFESILFNRAHTHTHRHTQIHKCTPSHHND